MLPFVDQNAQRGVRDERTEVDFTNDRDDATLENALSQPAWQLLVGRIFPHWQWHGGGSPGKKVPTNQRYKQRKWINHFEI